MEATPILTQTVNTELRVQKNFQVGCLLLRRDHYLDALDRFKALIATKANWYTDILIQLYKLLETQYDNLNLRLVIAELTFEKKEYDTCFQELHESLEINIEFTQSYFLLSKLYRLNLYKNDIQKLFEKAFDEGIQDHAIIDLLPKIYLETDNTKKNIKFFKKLSEYNPRNTQFKLSLAELYQQAHETEKAAKCYETIAEDNPSLFQECATRCESLVKYYPNSTYIRELLLKLHIKACQPEAIIPHLTMLISLDTTYIKKAITHLKDALELFPQNNVLSIELADLLQREGSFTESVLLLKEILETSENQIDEIEVINSHILEKSPNTVIALELKATCEVIKGNPEEAVNIFDQILDLEIDDPLLYVTLLDTLFTKPLSDNVLYLHARCYAKKEHYLQALEILNQSKQVLSQSAQLLKATCYVHLEQWSNAKEIYQSLINVSPFDKSLHQSLNSAYTILLNAQLKLHKLQKEDIKNSFSLALTLLRKGQLEEALDTFQKLANKDDHPKSLHYFIARCFFEMGRYDVALTQCQALLKYGDSQDKNIKAMALFLSAISSFITGDASQGLKTLNELMSININFPHLTSLRHRYEKFGVFEFRGLVLTGFSETINGPLKLSIIPNLEGKKYLGKDTSLQSLSFAFQHNNKGVECALQNQLSAAEDEFNIALQLDANLTAAKINLSLLHILKNETDKGLSVLEEAEKINPSLDSIHLNKALLFIRQNNRNSAVEPLLKSLELNAQNNIAWLTLGDCYFEQDQLKKAFDAWQKAYEGGLLFTCIQRRIGYLDWQSYTIKNWINELLNSPKSLMEKYVSTIKIDDSQSEENTQTEQESLPLTPQKHLETSSDLPLFAYKSP